MATTKICAHPPMFSLAAAIILVGLLLDPVFAFGNTWQLVINIGTNA